MDAGNYSSHGSNELIIGKPIFEEQLNLDVSSLHKIFGGNDLMT